MVGPMAPLKSFYKGEPLGKAPACAICGGAGEGPRAQLRLAYGVAVWLCAGHRSESFMTGRSGRDLVASLWHVWRAAGCMTRRRHQALEALRARLRGRRAQRDRPGSYAWPALRRECQRRAGSGERVGALIAEIRTRFRRGQQRPPSRRTVQRWIAERPPGALPEGRPRAAEP